MMILMMIASPCINVNIQRQVRGGQVGIDSQMQVYPCDAHAQQHCTQECQ